jgi:hypothetical protein
MAPYVLRHRLILSEGASADEVLQRAMDSVPTPVPSRVEPA